MDPPHERQRMTRFRVVRDGDGWAVMKGNRRHFQKTYRTKSAAEDAARRAASQGDSVQAQGRDGRWDQERTYRTPGPRGDH